MEIEELGRLFERELEDLADRLSLPSNRVEVGTIARAAAIITREIGVGHERHLQLDATGAVTGRTTAAGGVEREAAGGVSTNL